MKYLRRKHRGLNRRTFLRGLLGGTAVAIGLPPLDIFMNGNGTAYAGGGLFPERFGLFYWGNGVSDSWVPTNAGFGADWQLGDQLDVLEPIKDVLTVISGMSVQTGNDIPHLSGASGILSGTPVGIITHENQTFGGQTVDQIVADTIGGTTRFSSLEFGAKPGSGQSYNGPNSQNPAESDPFALFERVFGAGFREPGDDTPIDPSIALRRSVLDAVSDDISSLQGTLGTADQLRLDQHLNSVRELELRLSRLADGPPDLIACVGPDPPPMEGFPDIDGRPQLTETNRALCDIAAMALACDQTRVISNFISRPINNLLFEGATAGHHSLTHDEPGGQPMVRAIVRQLLSEYMYMVEALRGVTEGDGTILDSSVVFATSDCSYGRTHSLDEYPILYAGSGCGRLHTNMHYRSPNSENASKAVLSIMRGAGVLAPSFGVDGGYVTDSLGAVEV